MIQRNAYNIEQTEGQKTWRKKKKEHKWLRVQNWRRGVDLGGCTVLLALFQTLQSGTVQWSYTDITHVNNMNKTDVIKTGPLPSPAPFCCFSALWWERSTTEGKLCCSSLTHSPPLSFALWLSFPLSSFHPSSLHSVSPWGCKAWLSTEAELSKLGGSAKEKSKRQKTEGRMRVCAFMWVCVCECQAQQSHFSLLGNMKLEKQQNYAAPYSRESYTGRNKSRGWRHRRADQKWKRTQDKVLTAGVLEPVWQGSVKQ